MRQLLQRAPRGYGQRLQNRARLPVAAQIAPVHLRSSTRVQVFRVGAAYDCKEHEQPLSRRRIREHLHCRRALALELLDPATTNKPV